MWSLCTAPFFDFFAIASLVRSRHPVPDADVRTALQPFLQRHPASSRSPVVQDGGPAFLLSARCVSSVHDICGWMYSCVVLLFPRVRWKEGVHCFPLASGQWGPEFSCKPPRLSLPLFLVFHSQYPGVESHLFVGKNQENCLWRDAVIVNFK